MERRLSRQTGRSIGAVLAGFLVVVVFSLATDAVMRRAGIFPPAGQGMSHLRFALATAYRVVYSVAASFVTASLAPNRPMFHAMLGGFIGLAAGILGAVLAWSRTELGPHWYPVALVVTALPCAWLGAKLRLAQLKSRPVVS
jgi:hypothetical protein